MEDMHRVRYTDKWTGKLCLLIAAFVWGSCLVAQKSGNAYIGPATFTCCRSFIAFVALIPVVIFSGKKNHQFQKPMKQRHGLEKIGLDMHTLTGGIVCGVACAAGMLLGQYGVIHTSVGKAGFITALYILIIPLMGIIWKIYPSIKVWISVGIAIVGLYMMCLGNGFDGINSGDVLMFFSAVMLSVHFYCIDRFVARVNPIKLSWLQFLFVGIICMPIAIITETISFGAMVDCALPILYAGVCSNALGYTLQMVGQQTVEPTKACLLMSTESVFSLLAGLVCFGEILIAREYIGCALMFVAIILSQLPEKGRKGSK